MSNDATLAPARKMSAGQRPPSPMGRHPAPAAPPTTIEIDSSAIDTISLRISEIQALASCATCLSAVEATGGKHAGYELIDGALPLLSDLIRRLAREAAEASDQLWEQYEQARGVANGKGCAA